MPYQSPTSSDSEISKSDSESEGDLPSAKVPSRDKKFLFSRHWLLALGAIKACHDSVDTDPPEDVRLNRRAFPF